MRRGILPSLQGERVPVGPNEEWPQRVVAAPRAIHLIHPAVVGWVPETTDEERARHFQSFFY